MLGTVFEARLLLVYVALTTFHADLPVEVFGDGDVEGAGRLLRDPCLRNQKLRGRREKTGERRADGFASFHTAVNARLADCASRSL